MINRSGKHSWTWSRLTDVEKQVAYHVFPFGYQRFAYHSLRIVEGGAEFLAYGNAAVLSNGIIIIAAAEKLAFKFACLRCAA